MKRSLSERRTKLSRAKQLLLEKRLRGESIANNRLHGIALVPRPERLRLSHAQQRLWFLDRLEGTSTEYNIAEALRLKGELDVEALQRAVNTIVERHESLRTHFVEVEGEPEQVIEAAMRVEVQVEDLSGLEAGEQRGRVLEELRREGIEPFDLGRGPVVRVKLLKLGEQEHVLLRTMHHIVSDGWSQGVFNREFMVLYEAYREGRENPLKPLAVQYADFALWQREWLEGGALAEGLGYWKEQLKDAAVLELPVDRARAAVQTFVAEACQESLSEELTAGLRRISRANEATLYMTLLAALGVLLSRYSGQDDIVVGSPIANRQEAQLEEMIGFFVNTLVMRVRMKKGMSFRELLGEVRKTALEAYQYQDIPFERLVEELSPERSLNRTPVFQVLFVLQNAPWEAQRMKALQVEAVGGDELRVHSDLEVHAVEHDGQLSLYWVYNRDLFEQWRMEQMARQYKRVLEAVIADAEQGIGEIDILSGEERQRILGGWNDTAHAVPEGTLPELFEEQVERTPEAVAVIFKDQHLSYGELNERANRVAHYLIGRGVGPEDVVGICLERSLEMIIGLLGVLKAGAAYLPLDPEYPAERLAFMLEDATPVCVLSERAIKERLPRWIEVLDLEEEEIKIALEQVGTHDPSDTERRGSLQLRHAVYVMYTSGSTGTPKGVVVTHSGIAALAGCQGERLRVTACSRVLQFAGLSFDASAWEVVMALTRGATLVVVGEEERSGVGLREAMAGQGVTHATLPPVVLTTLGEAGEVRLENLIVAGEACSEELVALPPHSSVPPQSPLTQSGILESSPDRPLAP